MKFGIAKPSVLGKGFIEHLLPSIGEQAGYIGA